MSKKANAKTKQQYEVLAVIVAGVALVALTVHGGSVAGMFTDSRDAVVHGAQPDRPVPVARDRLGRLTVRAPRKLVGYSRERFGPEWFDVDGNGCNTRADILRRDLTDQKLTGKCGITGGRLADPYTGKTIVVLRTVQIDHVVALAEAWQGGADQWPLGQRTRFANDPGNLLAVDEHANRAKAEKTADKWVPRAEYRCAFAVRVVDVKTRYLLPVSAPEKTALDTMLRSC